MATISELMERIHIQNVSAGWWKDEGVPEHYVKSEKLALIHSEITEALEGERRGLMDDHLPHRKMAEVELADAMIRIMDYGKRYGYDLEGAVEEKLVYNDTRTDHTPGARASEHGKKF